SFVMKIVRSAVVISSPPGTGVAMSSSGELRRNVTCGPLEDCGPTEDSDPLDGNGPFDVTPTFAGSAGTALVILSTAVQPLPSSVVFRSGVTVVGGAGVTRVPGGAPAPPVTLVRTTKAPLPNGPLLKVSPNGAVSCSTCAPAGGTNSKIDELGTLKLTLVNPTWNAGLLAPAAKICKRSGTDVAASIAICTLPMSERLSFGDSCS